MRTVRALVALLVGAAALSIAPDARGDEGELAAARERANAAAAELSDAQNQAGALEADIAEQEQRLATAEASLDQLRATMQEAAIDAYIGAAGDGGVLLVMGDDINRQVQAAALARLVNAGNADAVDDYRVVAEDAQVARAQLDASLAAQREVVESIQSRRERLDAELSRLEELERQRLAAEQAARDRAAAEAARVAGLRSSSNGGGGGGSSSRSAPSTPIATGNWICPVQGAVAFVDSWGFARSGGRRHQGVDMMSPRGTPTVAPVSGNVTHRGNSVGGLSWHLNGDDGNYYYGTHLDSYANEGAGHVEAGTVIGYVGDSGNARGAGTHLHFEIHPGGGAAVNPYPTVRAAC
jgi:murein DD-endopeptidase MepM/ murein hydrolase activator NlpD